MTLNLGSLITFTTVWQTCKPKYKVQLIFKKDSFYVQFILIIMLKEPFRCLIKFFFSVLSKEFLKSVYSVAYHTFRHFLIMAKKKIDVKLELQFSIIQKKTHTKYWHVALYT